MNKYILISLILATFFTACSKNQPIYTSKIYTHIKNDDILNAAKKVILLADEDFKIDSYKNNINAKRTIVKYKVYNADIEINTIKLSTIEENGLVIAKLEILQTNDYFKKQKIIKNPSIHNLLWSRINYVLGLNKTWTTCFEYNLKLNFDGILCNRLYNQNNRAYKSDIIVHKINNKKENKTNTLEEIDLASLEEINLPNFNLSISENSSKLENIPLLENIDNDNDESNESKTKSLNTDAKVYDNILDNNSSSNQYKILE